MKKVIVSQYGARRRYLVPKVFYNANVLSCLYTDSCNHSLLGKVAKFCVNRTFSFSPLSKLARRDTGIPRCYVRSSDFLQLKLLILRFLKTSTFRYILEIFQGNAERFVAWGTNNATHLYTMYFENIEFTKYCKKHGLKIIADIYEDPYIFEELQHEINNCSELQCVLHLKRQYEDYYRLRREYIDEILDVADIYVIPSEFVMNKLQRSSAYSADKAHVIPYASSLQPSKSCSTPIKGRILWVGNDPIRKGLVYCQRASHILKQNGNQIDFRIIGPIMPEIVNSADFHDLNFVGYCNKEQLENELIHADMVVFPTLSEGFAASLLEAAAYGIPIITSHASGFSKSSPAIFVNPRDVDKIVECVESLLNNRALRDEISMKMLEYSDSLSPDTFANSVLELLEI